MNASDINCHLDIRRVDNNYDCPKDSEELSHSPFEPPEMKLTDKRPKQSLIEISRNRLFYEQILVSNNERSPMG